ncbi:hypothetical protein [Deinococcus misasensis]|uniref:hypothetical protein n=1 Tax=Deinococcus misasensis TaxID=392413 RepID=UPI0005518ADD|nr:hypothetical protein [Deinococcus misasensis]
MPLNASQEQLKDQITQVLIDDLPPERQPRSGGIAWEMVRTLAHQQTLLSARALDICCNWLASQADAEHLPLIGTLRGIERFPFEDLEVFRARVVGARAFWQKAGTLPGIKLAALQMGYSNPQIIEHFHQEPTAWAEFSIILQPGNTAYTAWKCGDGSAAGPTLTVGVGLSEPEKRRVRALFRDVKPAHAKIRNIIYTTGLICGAFTAGPTAIVTSTTSATTIIF